MKHSVILIDPPWQSKTHSAIEATANILVGFCMALATQIVVFPWFGMQVSLGDNLAIGLIFTVVSWLRSFGLRRLFNALSSKEKTT
jgi:hypothetical protein